MLKLNTYIQLIQTHISIQIQYKAKHMLKLYTYSTYANKAFSWKMTCFPLYQAWPRKIGGASLTLTKKTWQRSRFHDVALLATADTRKLAWEHRLHIWWCQATVCIITKMHKHKYKILIHKYTTTNIQTQESNIHTQKHEQWTYLRKTRTLVVS